MAKAEWGTKRTCQSCGARFYDLQRTPATCPKCGTVYDPQAASKSRRSTRAVVPEKGRPPGKGKVEVDIAEADVELEEADLAVEGEEDEKDLIEDASELGEDDSDVAEVIEKVDEDEP
ncbi:MAG: TIGR02300 family protein [Dongiaceae bacterium]